MTWVRGSTTVPSLKPHWLLAAMHVPVIAFPMLQGSTGAPRFEAIGWPAVPVVLLGSAIQVWHSAAVARGERPIHWRWSFGFLLMLSLWPVPFYRDACVTMVWFVIASSLMLLPIRFAVPVVATLAVAIGLRALADPDNVTIGQKAWGFAYLSTFMLMGGFGLYAAARLVHLLDQLRDARAVLGDIAIGRERIRISRDLHDLLGQSMSAVSLKGQLALGLLERNERDLATSELHSVVALARSTLRDVRAIAHREQPITLSCEIERVRDLLNAAGIEPQLDVTILGLSSPVEKLLGWALREGITNVLRHSAATMCAISIVREPDVVRMTIENDGSLIGNGVGQGLGGLAGRAASLGGSVRAFPRGGGRFRLEIEVPERAK